MGVRLWRQNSPPNHQFRRGRERGDLGLESDQSSLIFPGIGQQTDPFERLGRQFDRVVGRKISSIMVFT